MQLAENESGDGTQEASVEVLEKPRAQHAEEEPQESTPEVEVAEVLIALLGDQDIVIELDPTPPPAATSAPVSQDARSVTPTSPPTPTPSSPSMTPIPVAATMNLVFRVPQLQVLLDLHQLRALLELVDAVLGSLTPSSQDPAVRDPSDHSRSAPVALSVKIAGKGARLALSRTVVGSDAREGFWEGGDSPFVEGEKERAVPKDSVCINVGKVEGDVRMGEALDAEVFVRTLAFVEKVEDVEHVMVRCPAASSTVSKDDRIDVGSWTAVSSDTKEPAAIIKLGNGKTSLAFGAVLIDLDVNFLQRWLDPLKGLSNVGGNRSTPPSPGTAFAPPIPQAPVPEAKTSELGLSCSAVRVMVAVGGGSRGKARGGALCLELAGLSARRSGEGDVSVACREVLGASKPPEHGEAETFLHVRSNSSSASHAALSVTLLKPRPVPRVARFADMSASTEAPSAVCGVDIPLVELGLTKTVFDRLQYWADGVSRSVAVATSPVEGSVGLEPPTTRQPSGMLSSAASSASGSTPADPAVPLPMVLSCGRAEISLCLDDSKSLVLQASGAVVSQLNASAKRPDDLGLRVSVADMGAHLEAADGSSVRVLERLPPPGSGGHKKGNVKEEAMLSVRTTSSTDAETGRKKAKFAVEVVDILACLGPDAMWVGSLVEFAKAPPGVFEGVEPNDLTRIQLLLRHTVVHLEPPKISSAARLLVTRLNVACDLAKNATLVEPALSGDLGLFLIDDKDGEEEGATLNGAAGPGFVQIVDLAGVEVKLALRKDGQPPTNKISVTGGSLTLCLCADTASVLGETMGALGNIAFEPPKPSLDSSISQAKAGETQTPGYSPVASTLMQSAMKETHRDVASLMSEAVDDLTYEDYPANADFLEGGRKRSRTLPASKSPDVIIRKLDSGGLEIIDDYLLLPTPAPKLKSSNATTDVCIQNFNVSVGLYDGYDWYRTRRVIEDERKAMRKRLEKIRQLLAQGQPADSTIEEESSTTLFNSVHLGLAGSTHDLSSAQLMSAIDDELFDDDETVSLASSWQSLPTAAGAQEASNTRPTASLSRRRNLRRSRRPALAFELKDVCGHIRDYAEGAPKIFGVGLRFNDLSVLDNIKTSTWKKFLTEMRPSEGGSARPTGAPMGRFQFSLVPASSESRSQEALLKLKLNPIRLYVDQDAIDFLKAFGAFKDDSAPPPSPLPTKRPDERVEIFPIRIKLDYKPKRVDYQALREGKTSELMNFFHFDGSDMTLRHAILTGVAGPDRVGEILQDIWTPDVKANQLADVISGIAPVRSVVNIGSGMADLVLLPIEQVRKDGRLARGLQKGTTSFAKSTALEAIKLGARLATGTQVILERAETVLGTRLGSEIRGEAMGGGQMGDGDEDAEMISRYADQPENVKEGMRLAYQDLSKNMRLTAQTILAVPLEVFNEGSGRAVVKAVPIAILHPMVGATGAISKTLLGLRHTLDPHASINDEDKYKRPSSGRNSR